MKTDFPNVDNNNDNKWKTKKGYTPFFVALIILCITFFYAGRSLTNTSIGISGKIDANAAISYVRGGFGDDDDDDGSSYDAYESDDDDATPRVRGGIDDDDDDDR